MCQKKISSTYYFIFTLDGSGWEGLDDRKTGIKIEIDLFLLIVDPDV